MNSKYPNCIKKDYFPNEYDVKIEMQNIKGFLIGIESQGDPNSRLEDSLNETEITAKLVHDINTAVNHSLKSN